MERGVLMQLTGVVLYLLWLFLLILKYMKLPKDRSFSYRHVFWGRIAWFRNSRTLILLFSLFICELFLPLRGLYFLFFATGLLLALMSLANLRLQTGRLGATLGVLALGILISSFSYFFVFS